MRVMGLDLSVTRTGIAFPDGDTMAVRSKSKGDDRRFEITEHVEIAARACKADLVVIEGLGGLYKGEAAREIPMLHGAVRLALRRSYIPFMRDVSPSTLKQFATGSGGASKTEMRRAAKRILGTEYSTDDECDADWLRIAGMTAYGALKTPVVPQEQVHALFWTRAGGPVLWPDLHIDGARIRPRVPAA